MQHRLPPNHRPATPMSTDRELLRLNSIGTAAPPYPAAPRHHHPLSAHLIHERLSPIPNAPTPLPRCARLAPSPCRMIMAVIERPALALGGCSNPLASLRRHRVQPSSVTWAGAQYLFRFLSSNTPLASEPVGLRPCHPAGASGPRPHPFFSVHEPAQTAAGRTGRQPAKEHALRRPCPPSGAALRAA